MLSGRDTEWAGILLPLGRRAGLEKNYLAGGERHVFTSRENLSATVENRMRHLVNERYIRFLIMLCVLASITTMPFKA